MMYSYVGVVFCHQSPIVQVEFVLGLGGQMLDVLHFICFSFAMFAYKKLYQI